MRTSLFVLVAVASGASAGLVHGGVNLAIVEPYIDAAIDIENQGLFASGAELDNAEFRDSYNSYRLWQKGGQVLAGAVLGAAMGSLFGMVFALSRNSLPGGSGVKKALALAGVMWLVIFFIPFLKYPANPPATGDPDTIEHRTLLYVSFVAISGFGAAGIYRAARAAGRGRRNVVAAGGYAALMIAAFVLMPPNPDEEAAPPDLVWWFRVASVLGVSSFWAAVPLILGAFWRRFRLDANVELRS